MDRCEDPYLPHSKVLCLFAFSTLIAASPVHAHSPALPEQNVILITLDGVRAEDIVDANHILGGDYVPNLRAWALEDGFFYGSQQPGDVMLTGNPVGVSRPGYRALFTGKFETRCRKNKTECPELDQETLVNRLIDQGIAPEKTGLFASWSYLGREMELGKSRAVQSVATDPVINLPPSTSQRDIQFYNRTRDEATRHQPFWDDSRKDRYTWAMAERFLSTRPRFLYISLLDSDEWAHKFFMEAYSNSIKGYDLKIGAIRKRLSEMKGYGENTSIIITTDHGRGHWNFSKHGPTVEGSREVWAFVIPSATWTRSHSLRKQSPEISRQNRPPQEGPAYSQLDIRPTVEFLMGLPITPGLRAPLVYGL